MCLDLPGSDTSNGNKLWLWACNGMNSQKWRFDAGTYKITYAANPNKCVDIPGSSYESGNQLQLWDCNGQAGQYWGYDSNKQTIFASNSVAVDALQFKDAPGALGSNVTIPYASMCMDLYGGNPQNGAKIDIWSCSEASKNQQWTIANADPGPGPSPGPSPPVCQSDMARLQQAAKADSYGKSPDGKCYSHVSAYIDSVGYGGICKGCFDSKIPSQYWAEAHQFADYLNAGHAAGLNLLNVQSQYQNNPYKAPAGAIVVVRAGTPGTHHPTAGDIAVCDNGYFWNGGAMGYGGSSNFPASNDYVLGIFIPTHCAQMLNASQVVV